MITGLDLTGNPFILKWVMLLMNSAKPPTNITQVRGIYTPSLGHLPLLTIIKKISTTITT